MNTEYADSSLGNACLISANAKWHNKKKKKEKKAIHIYSRQPKFNFLCDSAFKLGNSFIVIRLIGLSPRRQNNNIFALRRRFKHVRKSIIWNPVCTLSLDCIQSEEISIHNIHTNSNSVYFCCLLLHHHRIIIICLLCAQPFSFLDFYIALDRVLCAC